jgi:hypothetical protein
MLSFNESGKFTVQGTGKVVIKKILKLGKKEIHLEGGFDFSKIPLEDHEMAILYLKSTI